MRRCGGLLTMRTLSWETPRQSIQAIAPSSSACGEMISVDMIAKDIQQAIDVAFGVKDMWCDANRAGAHAHIYVRRDQRRNEVVSHPSARSDGNQMAGAVASSQSFGSRLGRALFNS